MDTRSVKTLIVFALTLWISLPRSQAENLQNDEQPACFEATQSLASAPMAQASLAAAEDLKDAVAVGSKIFYLNRSGGTYTPGANDSRRNRSSLVVEDSTIPAWFVSDSDWQEVMQCVEELFSPYNAFITDIDPVGFSHIEAVVGGSFIDLKNKLQTPVGGVAPFPSDCGVIEESVVFVFAQDALGDNRKVCEIIAHEIAHSYGLDHSYFCEDIMSYLDCGPKIFVSGSVPCGENNARECRDLVNQPPTYNCNKSSQNPVALLSERLGRIEGPEATGGCNSSNKKNVELIWWFLLAMGGFSVHFRVRCQKKK